MSHLPANPSKAFMARNPHLYGQIEGHITTGGIVKPTPKRIQQDSKPLMNKLEQEFFDSLKHTWSVIAPQAIRFRLGNGVWYKPDFVAWPIGFESQDHRMRVYEVKGKHAFRGGFENLKVAAGLYKQVVFYLVWKDTNGHWNEQHVLP